MEKGGYKIIDLKDNNITTTSINIPNIYKLIGDNNRKVLLLSGLTINGVQLADEFVKAILIGSQYVLHAYSVVVDNALTNYDIVVENDDKVTLQIKTVSGGGSPVAGFETFLVKEGE